MKSFLAALAVLVCAGVAATPPPDAAIAAAYADQCVQLKAGNLERLSQYYAAGYVESDPSGKRSGRDQAIAQLKTSLAMVKVDACPDKILSLAKDGDAYRVNVEMTLEGTLIANAVPVKDVAKQQDVWKAQGGAWQLVGSSVLENTLWISGGVVQHDIATSPAPTSSP